MLYASHVVIHLGNIVANVQAVREAIGSERRVLVAVKANAYGHGAVPVSQALEESGAADWLGVATVPEAIELRQAGVTLPILKMSPLFPSELEAALAHGVTVTVASEQGVLDVNHVAAKLGLTADAHVKIDTGMGRVGVRPEAAVHLAQVAHAECPHLALRGAFTHFPASDVPVENEFTHAQIDGLKQAVRGMEEVLGAPLELVHAANSGGVHGHDASWLSMVRVGISAYGYYPDATTPRRIPLRPGASVHSRVSFVKQVRGGETIGYGRTWTAAQDTVVATVPIGYADGYPRLLSNQAEVLIGGRRHPVAGRVCMDQLMVEVGADAEVGVGDPVVLMGEQGSSRVTCEEWAAWAKTITYEITCGFAPRLSHVYSPEVTEPVDGHQWVNP